MTPPTTSAGLVRAKPAEDNRDSDEAILRRRASDCRELGANSSDVLDRAMLNLIARDLERVADRLTQD
jgi:hypothetical protein